MRSIEVATSQRTTHVYASCGDVAATRHLFDEFLCLRAVVEDAKSVCYDAGDVILKLDWTLDCTAPSGEDDPRSEIVLLVDEIDAVQTTLEAHGVRFTRTDEAGISFALPDGLSCVMLELSDECLMWPSAGWSAGPSPVVSARRRPAPSS